MQVTDVLRRVRAWVGDENGSLVESEDVIDLINDAQIDLNMETKLIWKDFSFTTVANFGKIAVPSDFIASKHLWLTGFPPMEYVPRNATIRLYPPVGSTEVTGVPCFYAVDGTSIMLSPVPDGAYPGNMEYVCTPVAVTTGSDTLTVPLYLHSIIAKLVYAVMKERDEDFEAASLIKGEALVEAAKKIEKALSANEMSYPIVREVETYY